jgi:hypothetical protein
VELQEPINPRSKINLPPTGGWFIAGIFPAQGLAMEWHREIVREVSMRRAPERQGM